MLSLASGASDLHWAAVALCAIASVYFAVNCAPAKFAQSLLFTSATPDAGEPPILGPLASLEHRAVILGTVLPDKRIGRPCRNLSHPRRAWDGIVAVRSSFLGILVGTLLPIASRGRHHIAHADSARTYGCRRSAFDTICESSTGNNSRAGGTGCRRAEHWNGHWEWHFSSVCKPLRNGAERRHSAGFVGGRMGPWSGWCWPAGKQPRSAGHLAEVEAVRVVPLYIRYDDFSAGERFQGPSV
jgi:hypothetical protein